MEKDVIILQLKSISIIKKNNVKTRQEFILFGLSSFFRKKNKLESYKKYVKIKIFVIS